MRRALFLGLLLSGLIVPALGFSACTTNESEPGSDAGLDTNVERDATVAVDATPDADAADAAASTTEAKCDALFDAALAMARRCGARPGTQISSQAYNPSNRTKFVRACVAQANAPGYDTTRVDACLAEARTTTTCVDFAELEASLPPNFVFGSPRLLFQCLQRPGTLPAGSTCAYDSQCASLVCQSSRSVSGPTYCGVCAPGTGAPPPSPNGNCVAPNRCASGQSCTSGSCDSLPGNGERCSSSCAPGLACSRNAATPDTCQPLVPLDGDCTGKYCESRLTCVNGKCQLAMIGKLGDDCSFRSGSEVQCDEDLTCESVGTDGARSCVSIQSRFAQLGEACNAPGTMGCDRTLWCDRGTCQPREATRCSQITDAGVDSASDGAITPKDAN